MCTSYSFVAPEVINGTRYGKAVDLWSLGVISYILLCGYPPFRNQNRKLLFDAIRRADFVFDEPWWDEVSDLAKDFVSQLLVVDPRARMTMEELLAFKSRDKVSSIYFMIELQSVLSSFVVQIRSE